MSQLIVMPRRPERGRRGEPAALNEHGIAQIGWNVPLEGWQLECFCGWHSSCDVFLEFVGREFDIHIMTGFAR
jgi:hypothetical protein